MRLHIDLIWPQIAKVWVETDVVVETALTSSEIDRLLAQGRYEASGMLIMVRRRREPGRYTAIALNQGRSNGLQRFLYFTPQSTPKGTALTGVIRTRMAVKCFMTVGIGFLSLLAAVTAIAALVYLLQDSISEAMNALALFLVTILVNMAWLTMAYLGMATTESNEQHIIEWMHERLS